MAVKRLSNIKIQYDDGNGVLASNYRLFFYAAGSSTKQNTYNSSTGGVANANPIVLNALGEPATEIWLTAGQSYKVGLAIPGVDDPPAAFVWTEDNVAGVNDTTTTIDEWVGFAGVPTFVSATSFTLVGDQTTEFHVGRRVKTINSGGTVYGTIITSAFAALTTITVANDSGVLDAGLSAVSYGLVRANNTSTPLLTDTSPLRSGSADKTKKFRVEVDGFTTGTTRVLTPPDADLTLPAVTAKGDIVSASGSGVLVKTAVGGDSSVLIADSTASGGVAWSLAQGLVKLASGAASGTSLDIVMTGYTAYRHKRLVFDLLPATDAVTLALRFSTNGGSSYDAGATDYSYARKVHTSANLDSSDGADQNGIQIQSSIGNSSGEGIAGEINLYNTTSTTLWTKATWLTAVVDSTATPVLVNSSGSGVRRAAQDTDAIRLIFSAGNIASGNYALYGWN